MPQFPGGAAASPGSHEGDGVPDDPYALLGVAPDADAAALRRAYRARALACHPDVHPDDPRAVERFLALGQAYALLADPLRRAAYDLERGVPAPVVRFDAAQDEASPSLPVDDAFFVAAPKFPRRGADVRWTLDIPANVAEDGGRLHIGAAPVMACPACAGTGARLAACWVCGGRGTIAEPSGAVTFSRTCPACAGKGLDRTPCTSCRGSGRAFGPGVVVVHVPAGTATGDMLVVPGAGEPGRGGAPSGDLLLAARVLDRDGRD